jgi:D-alanyl-D-alanine carboxypeptidase
MPAPPKDLEARRTWLKARIDEILACPALGRAKMSVAVMDPESGKLLYAKNEKTGLNAASNVKIVTEAAAWRCSGRSFAGRRRCSAPSRPRGKAVSAGELRGDLYVKTSGDPTLSTQDLNGLAASLAAIGTAQGARRSGHRHQRLRQHDRGPSLRAEERLRRLSRALFRGFAQRQRHHRDHHARGDGRAHQRASCSNPRPRRWC